MANRLTDCTSPYLLAHQDNPVDWWPWCPEAFAQARERDVPVLISVGYSACHWCHVMAHESFEDPATAELMNRQFICIKVDREERPDVDAVYMEATQAMTGRGGWPMTVFATPDGEPFYCGTYFPPTARPGMPAFGDVLNTIALAWAKEPVEISTAALRLLSQLAEGNQVATLGTAPDEQLLARVVTVLCAHEDVRHGGFGGAPKFPPATVLLYLLRHHARTGSGPALALVTRACEAMARGGIYDQLGGGFARYAVDPGWVVPHFEKMLYDNALLLRVYTSWFRLTDSELAARVANETADWLLREMWTTSGGFASALDADSDGVEGKYYVWAPEELRAVLGERDGAWAAACFGVSAAGTFEHGTSVLQRRFEPDDLDRYAAVRTSLRTARAQRVPPARDDKVVAAWNGLAVAALAEAGELLGRPALVGAARATARTLADLHTVPGTTGDRLLRVSRAGRAGPQAGVLEDYGDVAEGYLTLYQVTGETEWVQRAGRLLDTVLSHFGDSRGAFYDTADDAEVLVLRPRDWGDTPTPSGTAAAAGALLTYSALVGSARHRAAAASALAVSGAQATKAATAVGWGLAVAEALLDGPRQVAVVGDPADDATQQLHRSALRSRAPGVVVALGDPADAPGVPLLADRPLVAGRPAAYVCRDFTCSMPTTDPAELAEQLAAR
ncbi:MAG TPA: thioredoxin domain-containing protein [Sporichthyaceae bacterium]|jgi:hypothetical protein|nr:thioredoxin domain-containing protein [Sporichthyaceae bacterium]